MIGAYAIGKGVLNLGSSVVNYMAKRKMLKGMKNRPSWESSDQAAELKRQQNEGIYSPTARQNIMSRVGQNTAQVENQGKAGYMGQMTRMGLENSVAGARGLADYTRARMKTIATTGENIDTENEMSKVTAAEKYGELAHQDEMDSWNYKNYLKQKKTQNNLDLVNGITGAAGGMMDSAQSSLPDFKKMDSNQIWNWAASYQDPAKAEKIINMLIMSGQLTL